MEQGIYVDVLLVTNYIINMLLISCVSKLSGRSPKRRRIVAAALFGAATSLTIFLPFTGFFSSLSLKLAISAAIVLIAFRFINTAAFLKQIFLFFAVSFCFAGLMLGIWLTLSPRGMTYYNGVVYFDISPVLLLVTTIAAYALMLLYGRFSKAKKLSQDIYQTTIHFGSTEVSLKGLVDTGNHLTEPFSGTPVVVANVMELAPLLPKELSDAVANDKIFGSGIYSFGVGIRMIPYSNVGGSGVLPAIKADFMTIETKTERMHIEQVYIGLSRDNIGNEHYSCLLNPDLLSIKIH